MIYETILLERMTKVFNKLNLFSADRFGFSSKRPWMHAISQIADFIRSQTDKILAGEVCFFDLNKGFVSLNHEILFREIFNYGFRGSVSEKRIG